MAVSEGEAGDRRDIFQPLEAARLKCLYTRDCVSQTKHVFCML